MLPAPRRPAAVRHPVSQRRRRQELLPEALGAGAAVRPHGAIHSSQNERDGDYLICENVATLLWLGQMAGLELHAWFSRVNPEPDGPGMAGSSPAPRPRSSDRSSTTPTSSSSTSIPTSTRVARAGARSRSCTGAPSPGCAASRSGSGRSSTASASSPSSRRRAGRASTSTCRSCATSISTRRAAWRRPSRGTCSASGPRT